MDQSPVPKGLLRALSPGAMLALFAAAGLCPAQAGQPQGASAPARALTPLGREYRVTDANATREAGGLRSFLHHIRVRGRRGDRFRISLRAESGEPPAERIYADTLQAFERHHPPGQTPRSSSRSFTVTLTRDGEHFLVLAQAGISGWGRTLVDPVPYMVRVDRLN